MGQLSRTAKLLCWSILLTFQKLMIEALLRPPVSSAGHQCVGRGRSGLFVPGAIEGTTGLVCHCRKWNCSRQLDASVGASGPHDFAVRGAARSPMRTPRPPHPAPSVTISSRPLCDRTSKDVELIWAGREPQYFCKQDWTAQITLIRHKKMDLSGGRKRGHG